jgi:hypothetical protein
MEIKDKAITPKGTNTLCFCRESLNYKGNSDFYQSIDFYNTNLSHWQLLEKFWEGFVILHDVFGIFISH